MKLKNVVLEIGTEEIPSRFLPPMIEELRGFAEEALESARLGFKDIQVYATPRRLVLMIGTLDECQKECVELLKGPPMSNAYDSAGNPTRAALGFAKSKNVSVDALKTMEVGEVCYVAAEVREESKATLEVLPGLLRGLISRLIFPKNMYWKDPRIRFARPIRWILALADEHVIPFRYGDVESGRMTSGHRFMGQKSIEIKSAGEFMERLYDNNVILDQEKRRQKLEAGISMLKQNFEGALKVELDPELVEENLYLVEFPIPFIGSFDERFLEIPREVLVTSMKKNQKYFAVYDKDRESRLANYFIGVSNNRPSNINTIREGNERVLQARLEDAAFFWDEDRKRPLASRVEHLKNVIYQESLGSVYDKVLQTQRLAGWLCSELGRENLVELVERAALLSKADLLTSMVFEFPELQGVMGREYALHDGEDPRVALALYEQYLPRSAADTPPTDDVGALLGLAERVHVIVSCHKAGLEPTGSQDPYALRRAARCINEIVWARNLDLDLLKVVETSALANLVEQELTEKIIFFLRQRLLIQLKEKGFEHELTLLALSVAWPRPLQTLRLLEALDAVKDEPWLQDLATSAVRVKNILQKAEETSDVFNPALAVLEAENALNGEMERLKPSVSDALEAGKWQELMVLLAELSPIVTDFFDNVMVMDPDERVRNNRLALLKRCNALFERVGDMTVLKSQGKRGDE
ncbi:MAG: glycine--tRNA ligase subunit beta [Fretibacterium sp.]|nr:glycine--tRNA ligase subunit beta [Fretibacterium sp.]